MLVRILLSQQQHSQAVEMLSCFREHLNLPGDIKTTIEWMVLSVVALYHVGKREEALSIATRLLWLTSPENSIRVYLDAGEPMRQVLLSWLSATHSPRVLSPQENDAFQDGDPGAKTVSISRAFVSHVLAAFAQEKARAASHVLAVDTPLASLQEIQRSPILAPEPETDPLSRQELKVLRLLVVGHTYAEIARALIVSPHTVKTQVSSIYRKLGVRRRAEAIAVTSRLHLL